MKIKVDRTNTSEGDLVFKITVSEPNHVCFSYAEKQIMNLLDNCKEHMNNLSLEENKTKDEAVSFINIAKEKTFLRILDNLKFAIENEFRTKFKPICQEIYNWIYDHQTDSLKNFMLEFDPQRTKYYFDNDITMHKYPSDQQSEHIDEDFYDND